MTKIVVVYFQISSSVSNLECLFLPYLTLQVVGKNYPFHQCEGCSNTIVPMHTQN